MLTILAGGHRDVQRNDVTRDPLGREQRELDTPVSRYYHISGSMLRYTLAERPVNPRSIACVAEYWVNMSVLLWQNRVTHAMCSILHILRSERQVATNAASAPHDVCVQSTGLTADCACTRLRWAISERDAREEVVAILWFDATECATGAAFPGGRQTSPSVRHGICAIRADQSALRTMVVGMAGNNTKVPAMQMRRETPHS